MSDFAEVQQKRLASAFRKLRSPGRERRGEVVMYDFEAEALYAEFCRLANFATLLGHSSPAAMAGLAPDDADEPTPIGAHLYVTGLLDEIEFMGQLPERHGIVCYGPFITIDGAQENARTLSTDPDEAVVLEVIRPTKSNSSMRR